LRLAAQRRLLPRKWAGLYLHLLPLYHSAGKQHGWFRRYGTTGEGWFERQRHIPATFTRPCDHRRTAHYHSSASFCCHIPLPPPHHACHRGPEPAPPAATCYATGHICAAHASPFYLGITPDMRTMPFQRIRCSGAIAAGLRAARHFRGLPACLPPGPPPLPLAQHAAATPRRAYRYRRYLPVARRCLNFGE